MTDIKPKAREMFEKQILNVNIGTDWGICPSQVIAIENFIDQIIDLTSAEERKTTLKEIEESPAYINLRDWQKKADEDGATVLVSRQALDELLSLIHQKLIK